MKTVDFTAMKDGTKEEYLFLKPLEDDHVKGTARPRHPRTAPAGGGNPSGLQDQPSRTWAAGRDARLSRRRRHRLGGRRPAPRHRRRPGAAEPRPLRRRDPAALTCARKSSGRSSITASFQMYYYAHHYGWNQHEREKYRDSIYYQSCVDFCERWDQSSFDPGLSRPRRSTSSCRWCGRFSPARRMIRRCSRRAWSRACRR